MANNELLTLDDQTLASIMNKRHRSAAKSFKSPPQPRFCIKETLEEDGREVFINVLSYSRIANQLSELDPVPLYGGMIIKSYSSLKNSLQQQQQALQGIRDSVSTPPPTPPAAPSQLIFAVMASPEVLKKCGRNFPADSPEQMNLIELMCEFVMAMNPGLQLSKKPQILKDRDLQGELKDVWTAVQNFREKEKSGVSDIVVYTEFGPDSAAPPPPLTPIVKDNDSIEACMKVAVESSPPPPPPNAPSENSPTPKRLDDTSFELTNTAAAAVAALERKAATAVADEDGDVALVDSLNIGAKENDSNIDIDKLSIGDKKSKTNNGSSNNGNENESSEKNVKVQNQKNKESQHHHFFPKFLSSNKERDKDNTKDKEKDKEKVKKSESGGGEEQSGVGETKVKTKKSLNFFRRNKNVSTGSPTHNNSNSNSNANNIANE